MCILFDSLNLKIPYDLVPNFDTAGRNLYAHLQKLTVRPACICIHAYQKPDRYDPPGGFTMTFYRLLVLIHVFSAILGLGPGFMMIYIVTRAQTMTELRHAYLIRNRLHIFVMIGGTMLLITGLVMGSMNPYLFHQGWYVTSLILFLIALGFGPLILSPRSRPVKALLKNHPDDTIPEEYYQLAKKLFFYERIENVIFLIIIVLMVLKPF